MMRTGVFIPLNAPAMQKCAFVTMRYEHNVKTDQNVHSRMSTQMDFFSVPHHPIKQSPRISNNDLKKR